MCLYAAATRVDITAGREDVHDRLYAKLLLLRDGQQTNLLISMDCVSLGGGICEFKDGMFEKLQQAVQSAGITNLICGTTHTHTLLPMVCSGEEVIQRILNALSKLQEELVPVTAGSILVEEKFPYLINRTIELKDGTDWTVRQAHPCPPEDAYDTLTEANHTFKILRLNKEDGTPLAILFNFGCHPLLGYADNKPTANYPGIAESIIEKQTGATAMLFQHTGGDSTESIYKDFFHPKDCRPVGEALGQIVLRYASQIETKPATMSTFAVWRAFPLRQDIPQKMESIRQEQLKLCESLENCPLNFKNFLPLYMKYLMCPEYPLDHKFVYLQEEFLGSTQMRDQDEINRRNIQKYLDKIQIMEKLSMLSADLATLGWHQKRIESIGDHMQANVTGIRIGEDILISAPVEALTGVGKRIKELDSRLMLLSYSNGYLHYGATEDKYARGGYEVCECDLAPQWLDVYLDAVTEIIKNL